MSASDFARHRAPRRPVTPLSDVTGAVTESLSLVGRSGAALAVSTGLLATVALPAHALTAGSRASSAPRATAPASTSTAFTTGMAGLGGTPFSSPANLSTEAEISAPTTATISFESKAFTAVPAAIPRAAVPRVSSGDGDSGSAGSNEGSDAGSRESSPAPGASVRGSSVLSIAARYVGVPYLYGGTTPKGFDCSGYVGYVYRQLGVSLPRTANQQMNGTQQISRSQAKPGDLVFFVSGGRAYHNGIYAGGNQMYDAPRSGKTVQKRDIWSADVVFRRVS